MGDLRTVVEYGLGEDHSIREPSFHDDEIFDLNVTTIGDVLGVRLKLKNYSDEIHEIHLEGCFKLDVSGFHQQNVVYDIFVLNCDQILEDLESIQEDFNSSLGDAEKYFGEWFKRVDAKRVYINSSYGAELTAYCSKISIYKLS